MYEKRFVILETKVGDCFEIILPLDTSLEDAKTVAKDEWQREQVNKVKTTIDLAVMWYDEDLDELDYSSYDLIDYLRG